MAFIWTGHRNFGKLNLLLSINNNLFNFSAKQKWKLWESCCSFPFWPSLSFPDSWPPTTHPTKRILDRLSATTGFPTIPTTTKPILRTTRIRPFAPTCRRTTSRPDVSFGCKGSFCVASVSGESSEIRLVKNDLLQFLFTNVKHTILTKKLWYLSSSMTY